MAYTLEQELSLSNHRFQYHQSILNDLGVKFNSNSKILDFGCGAGYLVYQYRKRGVNAFGVDVEDNYKEIESLCVKNNLGAERSEAGIFHFLDLNDYRIPFADNTFDFIYSDHVFEHVQNYPEALAEIKRVLKPGGCCLHFFPPKHKVIESHTYVPFAGVIPEYPYLLLWALLGVRNEYQQGWDSKRVAKFNVDYLKKYTNYLEPATVDKYFSEYFPEVHFVEYSLIKNHPKSPQYLPSLTKVFPIIPWLLKTFQVRAVFTRKA